MRLLLGHSRRIGPSTQARTATKRGLSSFGFYRGYGRTLGTELQRVKVLLWKFAVLLENSKIGDEDLERITGESSTDTVQIVL